MIEFKDQNVSVLEYNLFDFSIDQTQFTVLKTYKDFFLNIPLTIGIIGESHFLILKDKFSEVLACISPKEESLLKNKLQDKLSINKKIHGFSIDSSISVIEDMNKIYELLDYFETENTISYEFPSKDTFSFKPVTSLKLIKVSPKTIVLETLHAYPNEHRVVYSISTISKG